MLNIGKTATGKRLELPVDLVVERVADFGRTGAGKTNTAVVIVEELLKKDQQVVVCDPVGVWHGVPSSRDGKGDGIPILILGGQNGDLPLSADRGEAIADFVVDSGASVILTIDFEHDSAKRRFCKDFARRLYFRKSEAKHRTPLMVVLEEAHLFVPQETAHGDQEMLGAFQRLMRQGRSRGIGMMLIDQRPASVNKNLLTQCELLVAHQITGTQDRKALEDWVKGQADADQVKQFTSTLASLGRGEAWFTSPGIGLFERVQVRQRETFDSSATPKPGQAAAHATARAAVDLGALRAQLAGAIAEADANDPKVLKARIVELERQVQTGGADPAEVQLQVDAAVAQCEAYWTATVRERISPGPLVEALQRMVDAAIAALRGPAPAETVPISHTQARRATISTLSDIPVVPMPPRAVARPQSGPAPGGKLPDGLRPAHQRILNALAWLETFGIAAPERQIIALTCGIKMSGTFKSDLSRLSAEGLVAYPSRGTANLTAAGRKLAEKIDRPSSLRSLHDAWFSSKALRPAHDSGIK